MRVGTGKRNHKRNLDLLTALTSSVLVGALTTTGRDISVGVLQTAGPRTGSFRVVFNGLPPMAESEHGGDLSLPLAITRRRAPRPKEEYVTALKKGNYMLKYGRRGQPHKAHFVLSEDLHSLSWTSKRARGGKDRKEISLHDVYAIEAGQGTEVFKRFPQHKHLKGLSFSILYRNIKRGERRSLDIVCSNEDEYELWFTGLTYFHETLRGDAQQINLPAAQVKTNPLAAHVSNANTSKQADKASEAQRSIGHGGQKKDLIGDVYIWGASSGTITSGRAAQSGSAAEGLQESWVPSLVHDTFRLDAAAVACGPRHAAMITKNGEAYTWGCGDAGRLGHGDCQSSTHPKMVMDLSGKGVIQVACGDYNTSAVTRDGYLYTWGDGTAGILGHGTPHRQWAPKRVERPLEGVTITLVTSGPYHTAAVASNGNLYTWGDGFGGKLGHGCLGVGDEEGRMLPEQVARGPDSVRQVAAGLHFTLMLSAGDMASQMYTWGRGTEGQLGHGAALPGTSPNCPEPTLVRHLEGRKFFQVACGGCNTLAVVEHDAGLVLKDYETVTKELDQLLPKKSVAPPAGLLVGPPGMTGSPSDGGYTFRSSIGGRRSRHGSMIGDMAHSIASSISMSRASKADSDCGA
eukprot:jgi/Tetstr1/456125/TSEL_042894.t1